MAERRSRSSRQVSSPYPGLRPFEKREHLIFFGREGQVDDLIEGLKDQHFLAVLGASGSGKSSLVRAGLIPALEAGMMSGAEPHWKVAIMRPGDKPMAYLAEALAPLMNRKMDESSPISPAEMVSTILHTSSFGLVEAAQGPILTQGENLLLVVDQFEELFRFSEAKAGASRDEATAFVKLLVEAGRQTDIPLYVVITMRSDFLGECPRFPGLVSAINQGQYLVPRLTRPQMREAVSGPAAVFREEIAPDLVVRLLNDIGDNPDQLPILQHALMRTWSMHTPGREITVEDYLRIGGLGSALDQHAEEIYADLEARGLAPATELIFRNLTEMEADGRGIRRPARLGEICASAEIKIEDAIQVVEAFRQEGRSFLMPPVGTPLGPDTVIDISHESFMRLWKRLNKWVSAEARSAEEYLRLARAARDHQQGKVNLWRQPELGLALHWRAEKQPTVAWARRYDPDFDLVMGFLEKSEAAWKDEEQERKRIARIQGEAEERKATVRKQRLAIIGLILLITLLGGLSWWAITESRRAEKYSAEVEVKQQEVERVNKALEIKNESIQAQNAELSCNEMVLKEKNEEIRLQKDTLELRYNLLEEAEKHLSIQAMKLTASNQELAYQTIQLRKSIRRALKKEIEANNNAEKARLAQLDAETKVRLLQAQQLAVLSFEASSAGLATELALKAYGLHVGNGGDPYDATIFSALQSAYNRNQNHIVKRLYSQVSFYESVPNADKFVALDKSSFRILVTPGNLFGSFVEDQRFSYVKGAYSKFDYWAQGTNKHIYGYYLSAGSADQRHDFGEIEGLTCLDDASGSNFMVAGTQSGKIWKYDVYKPGEPPVLIAEVDGPVYALKMIPSKGLIMVGTRQNLQFLTINQGSAAAIYPSSSPVTAIAVSNDLQMVAYGMEDGHIGIINLTKGDFKAIDAHSSRVSALVFSADDKSLASGSYDQSIRLFQVEDMERAPAVINGHTGWVLALDVRGGMLYSNSRDGTRKEWYLDPELLVEKLCEANSGKTLTKETVEQYKLDDDKLDLYSPCQ